MSGNGNSVRKLPPGQMQKLKELFEEGDAKASGATLYGISPRSDGGKERPVSLAAQPKPTSLSDVSSAARKTWVAPDFVSAANPLKISKGQENLPLVLGQSRRRCLSEKQEWPTPADRAAAGQKERSPTVSKQVTLFSDNSGCVGEKDTPGRYSALEQRERSPVKRSSDPVRDESALSRYSIRQRAMSDVSFNTTQKAGETVRVLDRLKKFEEKPSSQGKPVVTVLGQPMLTVSNAQKRLGKTDLNGQSGDSRSNVQHTSRTARNVLKSTLGDLSSIPGKGKDNMAVSSKLNSDSKPFDQLSPPPFKPPRTFAHDEYLLTKVKTAEGQGAQNVKGKQSDVYNVGNVQNRVSVLNSGGGDKEEVSLRAGNQGSYSRLAHSQINAQDMREGSPFHHYPARLRPISEATGLRKHTDNSLTSNTGGNNSDSDGPVVISLKYGRRLDSPARAPGPRRDPRDQLPDTPEQDDDLQFSLRKSFSSECLLKGSTSSLTEIGENDSVKSSAKGNSRTKEKGRKEHLYEALVDSEGYAVPHRFLRTQKEKEKAAASNGSAQKRPLGPTQSDSATDPIVAAASTTTTPVKEQDVEKVPRKKMNLVRQKINQAYEVLNTVFYVPTPSTQEEEGELDTVDHPRQGEDTTDSDSIVDVKDIEDRVIYCSSVRLKTSQSIKKSKEFLNKIYPQLFEYALIVGLCTKTDDPGYDPYVIHKFPEIANSDVSIPKFCFPDADEFRPGSMTTPSESYSFVLTNIDGSRLFGYCRRIQPRDSSLPEVICIVSPVDAFNMYNKLLTEMENRRSKSRQHAQELIAASFGRPLPKPGKVCHIRSLVNYESLLLYLGTEKLIKVFASMLMERRLILCSQHLSILTQTIHALAALLYPFHWQHVYIPILPRDMLEVCAAPMPFIIGILRSHLDRVTALELEDVIIVDLDKKQVLRSVGDELTLLPKKIQKALKTAINMCKIDSDTMNSQWLMVSEAFLRMFLETMGHFGQFICTQQDGNKTLLKEQFIAGAPSKGIRQFLEWFTETQMFEVFMTMQLEREHWGSLDLFMTRLGELQSKRQADGSHSKGLGRKVKDLRKAIKTKLK